LQIIKKKPDHIVNHNQKPYLWYIIFTMEVAVAAMPPGVDQCVLILDAGGYSRISAPSPGGILATLRIIADHYPERLAKAFIVDASSMFYYAWKVGRPFCTCKNKLQYMLISFQILMFLLT
jgi:uncharacterized protein (DUF2249 family)